MPITKDNKSAGQRNIAEVNLGFGLDNSTSDPLNQTVNLRLLKNSIVDRRRGSIHKRPGSVTNLTINNVEPLGMTEHLYNYSDYDNLILPQAKYLLAAFTNKTFRYNDGVTWNAITNSAAVDSRLSFSNNRLYTFSSLAEITAIAGGRPSSWKGPTIGMDVIGVPRPVLNRSDVVLTGNAGSGITAGVGYRYMITFVKSDLSGLVESDWDTRWEAFQIGEVELGPGTYDSITVAIANLPSDPNVRPFNIVRLYRTQDGGVRPYLVEEKNVSDIDGSGNLTFVDTLPDTQLGIPAAEQFENGPPLYDITQDFPIISSLNNNTRYGRGYGRSYLCAKFAQSFWFVDATNPLRLVFSKPYTGDRADLEQYPIDNFIILNEPITGLYPIPGRLLIFHARSISYISGTSTADFTLQPFNQGSGTLFHHSICSNGSALTWLEERGLVAMPLGGGSPSVISREIDEELQSLMRGDRMNRIHVGCAWNPSIRQFVYLFHTERLTDGAWEEVGTGNRAQAVAGWEEVGPATQASWSTVGGSVISANRRVKFWAWNPELSGESGNMWTEYTFARFTDSNAVDHYPAFLFHPQPSHETAEIQQDKTYIGYGWNPTTFARQSGLLEAFDRSLGTDDGASFTSELITGRIVPGERNGAEKFYESIGFSNFYADPTRNDDGTQDTSCVLYVIRDYDDPGLRSYTSVREALGVNNRDNKPLTRSYAEWINLHLTDTSTIPEKLLLTNFFVTFRERTRRGTT